MSADPSISQGRADDKNARRIRTRAGRGLPKTAKVELVEQLEAMYSLHGLVARLAQSRTLKAVSDEVVASATQLQHTDIGALLLYDARQDRLYPVASIGLTDEFLSHLGDLHLGEAVSGRAVQERHGIIVADLATDPLFASFAEVAQLEGYRAVYSTPLLTYHGEVIGALTAYFREPHQPSEHEILMVDLYSRFAAGFIETVRLMEAAQDAVRLRDEYFGSVAHDLRHPLTVIIGHAQLLRLEYEQLSVADDGLLVTHVNPIDQAAARMNAMIGELLDASQIQTGQPLQLHCQPTDLVGLVGQVASEHQRLTARHKIIFETTVPEIVGSWDPKRMERVLSNLIANAIKFSPDGGRITISLTPQEDTTGAWATVIVRDEGIGIPRGDLPYVFDRFHRARNAVGHLGGTGLGLAGARQIIEQHRGTMNVTSEEGVGSTFTVRLPLSPHQVIGFASPAVPEPALPSTRSAQPLPWDVERIERFLASIPIFQKLGYDALQRAAGIVTIKQFRRGQIIVLEDEPIRPLRVVAEGRIKIYRDTVDGREVILRLVGPGKAFGVEDIGAESMERFSAQAHESAVVLEMPIPDFIQLLSGSVLGVQAALETLGALLRDAELRICDLQTQSAEPRLAEALLQLAKGPGIRLGEPPPFSLRLTRQELAELGGTNVSTVSRTVSNWVKAGVIAAGREWIAILDYPALRAIARGARSAMNASDLTSASTGEQHRRYS